VSELFNMNLPSVFLMFIDYIYYLSDSDVGCDVHASDLYMNWLYITVGASQVLYFFGPSGTPHESLAVWSHKAKNFSDVLFKSHILKNS
jgi:hypothetical protein